MKIINSNLQCQLFICTNMRDDTKACGNKGSGLLREKVKSLAKAKELKGVKITKSGCLGFCEEGIAAVMYPQQKIITHLNEHNQNDLLEIIEKSIS